MPRFKECPNCSNSEPGDDVYECIECGENFCDYCKDDQELSRAILDAAWSIVGMDEKKCPHCGESSMHHEVIYTFPDDEDDEDDD